MTPSKGPTVALFAHRFAEPMATGIGHAARELRAALDTELAGATGLGWRAISCSPPEASPPGPPLRAVTHVTLPGPRKARYAAWTLAGRPRLDGNGPLGGVDLVHVLHPAVAVPTRAPVVHTVHDVLPLLEPGWYARSERWLSRRAHADLAERSSRILCVSPYVATQVVELLDVDAARVTVVPNGLADRFRVTPATFHPGRPAATADLGVEPGRYLLHVGAITRRKNLVALVAAVAALPPAVVPALVLAGPDGLGAEAVRAEVDRLGLADRVRFAGYVPDDALPGLVAGAAALVHPSLGEGFGLTPLEAMAAGTPVVVAGAGSLPGVVGDAGVVVGDVTDGDAWAAAIASLLADDERRAALVTAGRSRAATFTWTTAARATLAVYGEVLAAGS
ncbi:MAG: glycosyltransferase family 1 protein [Acidimicrobiales bacterium]